MQAVPAHSPAAHSLAALAFAAAMLKTAGSIPSSPSIGSNLTRTRNGLWLTAFLGTLSALAPWSIDMSLPALTAIEAGFAGAAGKGPLTLSLFLVGFAIAPLFGGPIADRFGRRPALLVSITLYMLSALGAAVAPTFETLLACRLLQGLAGGACVILPLAIVRDLCEPALARLQFARIFAILNVVPIVVPPLGAAAVAMSGWRAVYLVQAIGALAMAAGALLVKESLPAERRRSLRPAQVVASYRTVLSDAGFVGYALIFAFSFSAMFSFISAAPSLLMGLLNVPRSEFAVLYSLTAASVLAGALISGQLARWMSARRVIALGLTLMIAGALAVLALEPLGLLGVWTLVPLIALVNAAFGLIGPSANHEAMRDMAEVAGAAAGVLRCLQMLFGAIASAGVAVLQTVGHPVATTASLMTIAALLGGATFLALRSRALAKIENA
jgi:MFS transporter, DHA1 family, multidrug resistance protein